MQLLCQKLIPLHVMISSGVAMRIRLTLLVWVFFLHLAALSSGKLVETLDSLGLRENTLIYLTSDHGAQLEAISPNGEAHGGWNGIYKGWCICHS